MGLLLSFPFPFVGLNYYFCFIFRLFYDLMFMMGSLICLCY